VEHELACDRIRDDIAALLFELERPTSRAAFAAARATGDIADALHHASGTPDDPRWYDALASLEEFLVLCTASSRVGGSPAMSSLRSFLQENAVDRVQQLAV